MTSSSSRSRQQEEAAGPGESGLLWCVHKTAPAARAASRLRWEGRPRSLPARRYAAPRVWSGRRSRISITSWALAGRSSRSLREQPPQQPGRLGGEVRPGQARIDRLLGHHSPQGVDRIVPRKGGRPVSISWTRAPNEKRSERSSTSSPRACSGDMAWQVPRTHALSGESLIFRRTDHRPGEAEVEDLGMARAG